MFPTCSSPFIFLLILLYSSFADSRQGHYSYTLNSSDDLTRKPLQFLASVFYSQYQLEQLNCHHCDSGEFHIWHGVPQQYLDMIQSCHGSDPKTQTLMSTEHYEARIMIDSMSSSQKL